MSQRLLWETLTVFGLGGQRQKSEFHAGRAGRIGCKNKLEQNKSSGCDDARAEYEFLCCGG